MRHEIDINEFDPIIREFAGYKSYIQGCSQRTVEQYLIDLRTFFRYLEAKRTGVDPESEEFTSLPFSHIDIAYLADITGSDVYEFMLYAGEGRGNGWSAKSRKLSTLKVFFPTINCGI